MNTSIRTHFVSRTRRVVAVLAAVVWVTVCCSATSAEPPQPKPAPSTPAQQKASQAPLDAANALDQLSHQIEALESELRKVRAENGANDPRFAQAQEQALALRTLQKTVLQLTDGKLDEKTLADVSNMVNAVSGAIARAQTEKTARGNSEQSVEARQLQQLKDQFAYREKQLAEREQQLANAAKQLAEERRPPLPSLENGSVKIYRFAYANARDAAKTVESLFGNQSLRASVDDRSNLLIVYGKPDTITALDALLTRIDEQASPNGFEKSTKGTASPRSLMLRVFWLADGLPATAGQDPAEFLPKSVLTATQKLGLDAPRLVTQTVTSLATGKDDAVDFSTNVPAVLLEQPVGMNCEGTLKLVSDDRVRVEMGVHVGGAATNCDLRGSMATPLGHYMVLGTANSVLGGGAGMTYAAAPGVAGPGEGGRGLGPGPPQPGAAGLRRGTGPGGAAGPEGGPAPGGEFGVAAAPTHPGNATLNTSRFAFVVQVIDGQSYPAEKEISGSK